MAAEHNRLAFSCGQEPLDAYIRKFASQCASKDIGRTFVAVAPGNKSVLGYYTLSSSSVAFANIPAPIQQKLPRYPIPVALIGKLAVDQSMQGQGLGAFLLMDALHRIAGVAEQVAIYAVEVHALDKFARDFYLKYGFRSFTDDPHHLFLPMATVKKLF